MKSTAMLEADMKRVASFERLRGQLRDLLRPGFVGDFDSIELIEIIATPRGGKTINVLSIAVLSERCSDINCNERTKFLTDRITIEGFKDWGFGVARTLRPVAVLDEALATLSATGVWGLSGKSIGTGKLHPSQAMFAAPDGSVAVPLNNVLKNNFWAGSHVFRLTDFQKEPFAPFFSDRRRLQTLSDHVSAAVPISFAALSDLLGDVLIQVPVTVVVPNVAVPRSAKYTEAVVTWRPGQKPRDLVIAGRSQWDQLLTGASVSERFQKEARLSIDGRSEPVETEIWDASSGILLGATASTSTFKTISIDMHAIQHECRLFCAPDADNNTVSEKLTLTVTTTSSVGEKQERDENFWLGLRQDLEEKRRLDETRDFKQYRPQAGSSSERAKALADIRFLIQKHGTAGVDLWDPYLTSEDILSTLFYCSHSGVPLRALTDGRDPPTQGVTKFPFPDRQRHTLERDGGNRQGLRLEYRTRRGPKGWIFHDRFLIFPNRPNGPLAWSLGTSVNSLGLAHHILQRVSNPALVAGAFSDLWSVLDEPEHVIWKSW